uniref:Uncharacterized protein n=1 Tax=Arundo donax TaxID=35708 RepID=A0A0A9DNE3_ARUDO
MNRNSRWQTTQYRIQTQRNDCDPTKSKSKINNPLIIITISPWFQDVDLRHLAFSVAVVALSFFPFGGVRFSMPLSESSTLATSAPMPPPNQNVLHLKNPPPPRRRLSEVSLSTWACSALHCTWSLATSSRRRRTSWCCARTSRLEGHRPGSSSAGLGLRGLLKEALSSARRLSLPWSEKSTCTTERTGMRSFWTACAAASAVILRASISLHSDFFSSLPVFGCALR